ncbi:MAG: (2Fe-2S)-binding protein [Nannocystaceae bacterium]
MSPPRPLLAPRSEDEAGRITIYYDGEPIPARDGEPISAALLSAGILATTRSPKYRRPRGPYCLRGECGSCQVRIGGLPNVRACTTLARDGLAIESQNHWGPPGLDPTPIVDRVFRGGMDHHHLMVRPRIANEMMQRVARSLTGFGTLADADAIPPPAEHRSHRPEVLVIGAGPAGRRAALALEAAGLEVLAIDRRDRITLDRLTLDRADEGPPPRGLLADTGVFAAYPHEQIFAAASAPLVDGAPRLHTIHARHVVLATGARDPLPLFPQTDLPGVVSARGLAQLHERCDVRLIASTVIVGEGALAESLAAALGGERVAPDRVVKILGDGEVTGIQLVDRTVACRLVALAPTPAPTHELAAQAGARLTWSGDGFAIACDADGRVEIAPEHPRPWTLWACGDLRGYLGREAAAADGERVAGAIAAAIAEEARR